MAAPPLLLIDGHAAFYRAYYAIRRMNSRRTGEATNMVFGFAAMLAKLLRETRPEHLVVVIDASGDRGTFRSQIYPQYKAHRDPPPEDFSGQVERCLELLRALRIPVLAIEEVEADDVIASVVERLRREHPEIPIRICSRDKDLTQLLGEGVELYDPQKDAVLDTAAIFGREGLEPAQVPDALALMGDPVDNVPGVAGIGPKTAAELVIRHGSLEGVLAHLDELTPKRRAAIEAARELLPLARRLVELRRDLPIPLSLEEARVDLAGVDRGALLELLEALDFRKLREEFASLLPGGDLPGEAAAARATAPIGHGEQGGLFDLEGPAESVPPAWAPATELVLDESALDRLVAAIGAAVAQGTPISIDCETTGLVARTARLCGVSASLDGERAFYIPIRSPHPEGHLDEARVLAALAPILADESALLLGHNLKYDLTVLRCAGAVVRGRLADSMVESHLVDADRVGHGLKDLAEGVLGVRPQRIEALIGSGKAQRTFDTVPVEQAAPYAGADAVLARRLHDRFAPQIESMGLEALCREVEFPLVGVLAAMERSGIRVDAPTLDRQRTLLETEIGRLRGEIAAAAPVPFNPDSPRQVAAVLFNAPRDEPPGLGLRPLKRGKTGPSTDSEVLQKLAEDPRVDSSIPELILEYRGLVKLVGTYLVALREAILPQTGRIHASFNQTATATGRLSSSDPNLQNIPVRTARGREIRRAFVAEPGHLLLCADYSQVELRMLAHLSGDAGLLDAFERDLDIHTAVAAEVFAVEPRQVTPSMRSTAKMVNFGIVYGITAPGLARRLGGGTSTERAAEIIALYKRRFEGIERFLDGCVQQARTEGFVTTLLGRRRRIPQVHSRNPMERAFGERAAINTVVQGSAADLIKIAMVRLHAALAARFPRAHLLLQIHDELVVEAPREEADAVGALLRETMESAMRLRVPLQVDLGVGENWLDAG
jgi:DNA polymerase-1